MTTPTPRAAPRSRGEVAAEKVTTFIGSWTYIIGQAAFLALWFSLNVVPFCFHWDPWPWMGANIIMSALAAFATSFVLIAQGVASRHDRAQAERTEHIAAHVEKIATHLEHEDREALSLLRSIAAHLGIDKAA